MPQPSSELAKLVARRSTVVGASFVRPADTTAYASGDLVANSVTPAAVVPVTITAADEPGGSGRIRRCRFTTTKTGLAGTEVFRIHLFKNDPSLASGITNGDNGVFAAGVKGIAGLWMGSFDVTMNQAFADGTKGIAVPNVGTVMNFDAAVTQNLFALVEARSAYTPASGETFTIALEVDQD